jgi:hypothetical protein
MWQGVEQRVAVIDGVVLRGRVRKAAVLKSQNYMQTRVVSLSDFPVFSCFTAVATEFNL